MAKKRNQEAILNINLRNLRKLKLSQIDYKESIEKFCDFEP